MQIYSNSAQIIEIRAGHYPLSRSVSSRDYFHPVSCPRQPSAGLQCRSTAFTVQYQEFRPREHSAPSIIILEGKIHRSRKMSDAIKSRFPQIDHHTITTSCLPLQLMSGDQIQVDIHAITCLSSIILPT